MEQIQDRILKRPEVLALLGISKSSLLRAIERGVFPSPLKFTEKRAIGWRSSDINRWIQNLQPVAAKDASNEYASNGATHDLPTNPQLVGE